MTAEIAVMNKLGVALAADSAISIERDGEEHAAEESKIEKIYSSGDKLFRLTKHVPVAVMIYDSMEMSGIPWEVIVKAYGENLGEHKFEKLSIYADEFFKFIESNSDMLKYASKNENTMSETGVVFAGFGEKEYMPVLLERKMFEAANGKLATEEGIKKEISPTKFASIVPFAQQKIVHAFLQGIHPDHEKFIQDTTRELLDRVLNATLDMQKLSAPQIKSYLSEAHKMLDPLFEDWSQEQKNHWLPIVSMVGCLPKDELASMAEMLVNLTKFHRRINPENETVGGPIDVVLITKGDGFKWIKRKKSYPSDIN